MTAQVGRSRRSSGAARLGAALLVAAAAALTACGTAAPVASSPVGSAAPVITSPPSPTTSSGSGSGAGSGAGASDGTDLAACADGTCEVEVRAGDAIDFDGSVVRVGRLVVSEVDDGQVTVSASTGSAGTGSAGTGSAGTGSAGTGSVSRSTQSSSVGSENTLNGLSYRILSARGDTAVVEFSRS